MVAQTVLKPIELFSLTGWIFCYVNYISIKMVIHTYHSNFGNKRKRSIATFLPGGCLRWEDPPAKKTKEGVGVTSVGCLAGSSEGVMWERRQEVVSCNDHHPTEYWTCVLLICWKPVHVHNMYEQQTASGESCVIYNGEKNGNTQKNRVPAVVSENVMWKDVQDTSDKSSVRTWFCKTKQNKQKPHLYIWVETDMLQCYWWVSACVFSLIFFVLCFPFKNYFSITNVYYLCN